VTNKLDIPYHAQHVLQQMPETHARFEIEPAHDPTLAFDLVLPRKWVHSTQLGPVPQAVLQESGLCWFTVSLEPGAPSVAVTSTVIPYELPLDSLMQALFQREGFEVVKGSWFPGPLGLFYELTGTLERDGIQFVRRTSARADGARMVCVNSACAVEHWNSYKEIFWVAHVTFSLLKSSGSSQVEPWVRARTRGLSFEVAYPQSWSSELVEESSHDDSGIHVRLADIDEDKLYAYLLARAQRRPQVTTESSAVWLDIALRMLQASGLEQLGGPARLSDEEDPRSIAVEGWRGGYYGVGRIRDAELYWRVGFVVQRDVLTTFVLYSPKKSDDLHVALRAQRAFEILRGGFELLA
jgi:hypothetical protein